MSEPNSAYFMVNYEMEGKIKPISDADDYERGLILILLSSYSYQSSPIFIDDRWVKVGGNNGIMNNFSDMYLYESDEEVRTYLLEVGIKRIFIEGVDFDYTAMVKCDVRVILDMETKIVKVVSHRSDQLKGEENRGVMSIKADGDLTPQEKKRKIANLMAEREKELVEEMFKINNLDWAME